MNKTEIVKKLRSIGPRANQSRARMGKFGNVVGTYSWDDERNMVLFIPMTNHNWYAFVPFGNNRVSFAYFNGNNNMNWRFHNSNRDRQIYFASTTENLVKHAPLNKRIRNVSPAA